MSETLSSILEDARDSLREWFRENPAATHNDISDAIAEIADGAVPVYTGDLMAVAADDIDMATREPELGPAFDGSATPANIIAANIYEEVSNTLHGEYQELQEEVAEEVEESANA